MYVSLTYRGSKAGRERGSAVLSRLCRLCELGLGGDGGACYKSDWSLDLPLVWLCKWYAKGF